MTHRWHVVSLRAFRLADSGQFTGKSLAAFLGHQASDCRELIAGKFFLLNQSLQNF
jgi:hypothetical protein